VCFQPGLAVRRGENPRHELQLAGSLHRRMDERQLRGSYTRRPGATTIVASGGDDSPDLSAAETAVIAERLRANRAGGGEDAEYRGRQVQKHRSPRADGVNGALRS